MSPFQMWFQMGLEHILNVSAYDHILYLLVLCLAFPIRYWKVLLLLITAFTLGHSLSLAATTLLKIRIHRDFTEFLIALTVLIAAIYEIQTRKKKPESVRLQFYAMNILFGLIHGIGFSYSLGQLLGAEKSVFLPLLYFNLGIEGGQLIIVLLIAVISLFLSRLPQKHSSTFKLICLCIIALLALKISSERFPLVF
ncbi:MAG TPA: HupE/UreJ family protein [Bacteroidia bacterium]|nr:HupE/UreJ family protein [Bacteroidia bacterium]